MDKGDLGRIGDADRTTHEPSQEVVSALRVGIPCAADLARRLKVAEESLEHLADILAASAFDAERPRTSKGEQRRQMAICATAIAALRGGRILKHRSDPERVVARLKRASEAIAIAIEARSDKTPKAA